MDNKNNKSSQSHSKLASKEVENRDVIIEMLKDQLNKLEEFHKKSLDDAERIRFQYCTAMQELNKLKRIHNQIMDENKKLVKERSAANNLKIEEDSQKWENKYQEVADKLNTLSSQTTIGLCAVVLDENLEDTSKVKIVKLCAKCCDKYKKSSESSEISYKMIVSMNSKSSSLGITSLAPISYTNKILREAEVQTLRPITKMSHQRIQTEESLFSNPPPKEPPEKPSVISQRTQAMPKKTNLLRITNLQPIYNTNQFLESDQCPACGGSKSRTKPVSPASISNKKLQTDSLNPIVKKSVNQSTQTEINSEPDEAVQEPIIIKQKRAKDLTSKPIENIKAAQTEHTLMSHVIENNNFNKIKYLKPQSLKSDVLIQLEAPKLPPEELISKTYLIANTPTKNIKYLRSDSIKSESRSPSNASHNCSKLHIVENKTPKLVNYLKSQSMKSELILPLEPPKPPPEELLSKKNLIASTPTKKINYLRSNSIKSESRSPSIASLNCPKLHIVENKTPKLVNYLKSQSMKSELILPLETPKPPPEELLSKKNLIVSTPTKKINYLRSNSIKSESRSPSIASLNCPKLHIVEQKSPKVLFNYLRAQAIKSEARQLSVQPEYPKQPGKCIPCSNDVSKLKTEIGDLKGKLKTMEDDQKRNKALYQSIINRLEDENEKIGDLNKKLCDKIREAECKCGHSRSHLNLHRPISEVLIKSPLPMNTMQQKALLANMLIDSVFNEVLSDGCICEMERNKMIQGVINKMGLDRRTNDSNNLITNADISKHVQTKTFSTSSLPIEKPMATFKFNSAKENKLNNHGTHYMEPIANYLKNKFAQQHILKINFSENMKVPVRVELIVQHFIIWENPLFYIQHKPLIYHLPTLEENRLIKPSLNKIVRSTFCESEYLNYMKYWHMQFKRWASESKEKKPEEFAKYQRELKAENIELQSVNQHLENVLKSLSKSKTSRPQSRGGKITKIPKKIPWVIGMNGKNPLKKCSKSLEVTYAQTKKTKKVLKPTYRESSTLTIDSSEDIKSVQSRNSSKFDFNLYQNEPPIVYQILCQSKMGKSILEDNSNELYNLKRIQKQISKIKNEFSSECSQVLNKESSSNVDNLREILNTSPGVSEIVKAKNMRNKDLKEILSIQQLIREKVKQYDMTELKNQDEKEFEESSSLPSSCLCLHCSRTESVLSIVQREKMCDHNDNPDSQISL